MLRSYIDNVELAEMEMDGLSLGSSGEQGGSTGHDWKEEHEKILIEWADKAMCYRWLHSKAHAEYTFLNIWFTIPVIVISTVTGTANFAQDRFGDSYRDIAVMFIGGFNILAGIIQTVQNFLKISELNEAYRISSISWDKFYRNIKIEMAKHPSERLPVMQMFKMCKEEFDRLMETSPTIPENAIRAFKTSFKHTEEFSKISKPEICDVLISTASYKYIAREPDIISVVDIEQTKKQQHMKRNLQKVMDFSSTFKKIHGRYPLMDELQEQFEGVMSLKEMKHCISMMEKQATTHTGDSEMATGTVVAKTSKPRSSSRAE